MTQDIKTLELAKIYESQGYYEDALEIYSFLNTKQTSNEIKAGLKRMEKSVEDKGQNSLHKDNIPGLFEKWATLMFLKQRLDNFKKTKARLLKQ